MSELEYAEVMIGRQDWERFMSSLERLMSLHEKIIERQKELTQRNEALRSELEDSMKVPHPLPVVAMPTRGDVSRRFSERVSRWLKSAAPTNSDRPPIQRLPGAQPAPFPITSTLPDTQSSQRRGANLTCGSCGYEVTRPSNFCERCGVLFGGLYCRCGTMLSTGDRFCYNCGQSVL